MQSERLDMALSPFDLTNSINNKTANQREHPEFESAYVPFVINRSLGSSTDVTLYANELNLYQSIPKQAQYDFYYHALSKRKRFEKWIKASPKNEDIQLICEYYQMNSRHAIELLQWMPKEHLQKIRDSFFKGGSEKSKSNK